VYVAPANIKRDDVGGGAIGGDAVATTLRIKCDRRTFGTIYARIWEPTLGSCKIHGLMWFDVVLLVLITVIIFIFYK
jgi:hypothetical protein